MSEHEKQTHTSARRFRQESDRRFLLLAVLTLVIVGGGLIAAILGLGALLFAVPILMGGALLICVPWLLLTAIEKWRDALE